MTVGVGIECSNGIVLACDSLSTFARGVPVRRYTNKGVEISHVELTDRIAAVHAGTSTFMDKFVDRVVRDQIPGAAKAKDGKLDIVDFYNRVCEPVLTALWKEVEVDRKDFLGFVPFNFDLELIFAGAAPGPGGKKELRAYVGYPQGLTEPLRGYGTIGSGAAYAELFLKFLLSTDPVTTEEACTAAAYAVKGVELMDPYVGGDTRIKVVRLVKDTVEIEDTPCPINPDQALRAMEDALKQMGQIGKKLIEAQKPEVADAAAD